MAKLDRKLLKVFGDSGSATNFGQFGSLKAGTAATTKNIDTIQALAAYLNGWTDAVIGANRVPTLEDTNALNYLNAYMMKYLYQEGVPEWITTETYYIDSICKVGNVVDVSKVDENTGNAPAGDTTNWGKELEFAGEIIAPTINTDIIQTKTASGDLLVKNQTGDTIATLKDDKDVDFDGNISAVSFTGTHLGTFQRIASVVLSAAATEIDITGLDGNTDIDYKIIVKTKTATTGGTYDMLLRINGDTGANYVRQYLLSRNTAITSEQAVDTSAFLTYGVGNVADGFVYSNIDIDAKSGFFRNIRINSQEKSSASILDLRILANYWANSVDNITTIKLISTLANGFGIGTTVELYARR